MYSLDKIGSKNPMLQISLLHPPSSPTTRKDYLGPKGGGWTRPVDWGYLLRRCCMVSAIYFAVPHITGDGGPSQCGVVGASQHPIFSTRQPQAAAEHCRRRTSPAGGSRASPRRCSKSAGDRPRNQWGRPWAEGAAAAVGSRGVWRRRQVNAWVMQLCNKRPIEMRNLLFCQTRWMAKKMEEKMKRSSSFYL